MANDQRNIKFGYFLIPTVDAPLLSIAQEVERLGLDYIAVQDHPYQRHFVDTWTIDVLSGGRFELGLGAGAFWDAIEAYGGPRRSTGDALDAMAEAIEVIRMVWSGDRNLRFEGQHYQLKGAQSGPVPAHPIGIWLGVTGPRSLKLAGKVADGWLPSLRGDLPKIAEMSKRLDDAIADAGREPTRVRRVINVNGVITDGASNGLLQGPVNQWVDELTNLVSAYRFDTFIFWGEGGNQLQRFAEEVAPAVRERVAAK
ncbi:LLM class flavin-dependent oxidoreductase [Anaerolineae bacterium AMX1]|nr:LLM class flavin-dependent oxidoreductase [Anaerolineae bacterium AMX1]